jgi:hypothetical protein
MDSNFIKQIAQMKRLVIITLLLISVTIAQAQILTPVKWSYAAKRISKTEAVVVLKATMQPGWYIYSQFVDEGGPIPTSFKFTPSKAYSVVGKTSEPKALEKFEKTFSMNVRYFENSVMFQQKVKLAAAQAVVKGKLEFMACNDSKCLPPEEIAFSVAIK